MVSSELKGLPTSGEPLYRDDERRTPYLGDVVMTGDPDVVIRARDDQEIAEIMSHCQAHHIPVTFSGGHTGLTGAAATEEGVVIATEQVDKVLDIDKRRDGTSYVVAQPGILLGDLKEQVAQHGLFYPPDPTSYKEARLGGTVATNATGEDTLLYGPTRRYVRALKVVKANGEVVELKRPDSDRPPETKGTAGYIRYDPEIDLIIGSEGTLGYIAEVTLDLVPDPAPWWAAIGFFKNLELALEFVIRVSRSIEVTPRALELMDSPSLHILQGMAELSAIPNETQAAVYWKQEYRTSSEEESSLAAWNKLFSDLHKDYGLSESGNAVWLARTRGEQERFREWRHYIPSVINEQVNRFRNEGGGKVASDWWVPLPKIQQAFREAIRDSQDAGLQPIIFGHIGNGHPHINYMTGNRKERELGMDLIRRQCQRAVRWGGGVAGEHGLGKIHRDLLRIQHSQQTIDKMIKVKQKWDPNWILGRGTLFEVPKEF